MCVHTTVHNGPRVPGGGGEALALALRKSCCPALLAMTSTGASAGTGRPARPPGRQAHSTPARQPTRPDSLALAAADQLRQRVAWALLQVYVVGEAGLDNLVDEHAGGAPAIWLVQASRASEGRGLRLGG